MLRISSIELLKIELSKNRFSHVMVAARGGLEISAVSNAEKITVFGCGEEMFFTELVVVGMSHLKRSGLETLLGLNHAGRRVFLYHQLRSFLSNDACSYWDAREERIRKGLLIDDDWESFLRRIGYPKLGVRWKVFAAKWLKKKIKKQGLSCSPVVLKNRITTRKNLPGVFPWRSQALLHGIVEGHAKRILAHPDRLEYEHQSIENLLPTLAEESVDLLFLWDAYIDIVLIWAEIMRVFVSQGQLWLVRETDATDWCSKCDGIADWKIMPVAHFSYGYLFWIQLK